MAMKWLVRITYSNGETVCVKLATDTGMIHTAGDAADRGDKVEVFALDVPEDDFPPVPTIEECERERYRAWALNNEIPKGGDA